jgi:hypothetical protein
MAQGLGMNGMQALQNSRGLGMGMQGMQGMGMPQQQQSGGGFWKGLGEFFGGTPSQIHQIQRFNPQQQQALSQLLSMSQQGFKNPYQGFEPIAQQARSQFAQQTVPSLAERFTSLGSNNLASSPAFASQLGAAGAGLNEGLAALQSQYGLQNRQQLLQMLGLGLQPQFDTYQTEGKPGFGQQILPALGRLGVHAGAAALTGGASAVPSAISEILRMLSMGGQ